MTPQEIESKVVQMQLHLTASVTKLIDDGVEVVGDVKETYSELGEIFKAQPDLIDDVISDTVIAKVGKKLPWFLPEFAVRYAIDKIVKAVLKKEITK